MQNFLAYFVPGLSEDLVVFSIGSFHVSPAQLFAIALIFFLSYINTKGIKNGKVIQSTFTITKVFSIIVLIVFGFILLNPTIWHTNWANAWQIHQLKKDGTTSEYQGVFAFGGAVASALTGAIVSYDAWNNVTFLAAEIKNPKRNIGLSLLLGTFIVTALYVLLNLMFTAVLTTQQIASAEKDRVGIVAAQAIFGGNGTAIIAIMLMVATFGCNNGMILSGARVYYTMAKDGLFFSGTGKLNSKGVPAYALWAQAGMASILCLSGKYGDLLDMISFVVVIFYILTIAGIFILRKKRPDAERSYKAVGYPVLPPVYILMGIAFCVLLIIYKPNFTWPGLIIALAGVPIYFFTKRKTV